MKLCMRGRDTVGDGVCGRVEVDGAPGVGSGRLLRGRVVVGGVEGVSKDSLSFCAGREMDRDLSEGEIEGRIDEMVGRDVDFGLSVGLLMVGIARPTTNMV